MIQLNIKYLIGVLRKATTQRIFDTRILSYIYIAKCPRKMNVAMASIKNKNHK